MRPVKTGEAIERFMRDLAGRSDEIKRVAHDLTHATEETIDDVFSSTSATVLAAYSAIVMLTDQTLEGALIAGRVMFEARKREALDRQAARNRRLS